MDWKFCFCICIFTIVLTDFLTTNGHPVKLDKRKGKLQKLDKKTKIVSSLPNKKINHAQKKSNLSPGLAKDVLEDAKKKGTIRLSGPWHSDSGIDRNVDPLEDSYVKKVIASNEGLNFNKDMAEAGEVFDVNGIEDFYDKSALITYEVNGHEIPVHMKPKLTPQNQPMFPEYGHETPSAPEMASSRSGHTPSRYHPEHRATTFYGMSLKDMPEYKVLDTPSLGDKEHNLRGVSSRAQMGDARNNEQGYFPAQHSLSDARTAFPDPNGRDSQARGASRFSDSQPSLDRLSSEYAQANAFGQEDARMDNKFREFRDPHQMSELGQKYEDPNEAKIDYYNRKHQEYHNEPSFQHLQESRNERLQNFAGPGGRYEDQERLQSQHFEDNNPNRMFMKPSHSGAFYEKRPSDSAEFSDKPKKFFSNPLNEGEQFKIHNEMKEYYSRPTESIGAFTKPSEEVSIGGENRGVGKEFDGQKIAPADAENNKQHGQSDDKQEKADDSNKFFEQLEKIDEQRRKSSENTEKPSSDTSRNSPSGSSDNNVQRFSEDQEKSKAKEKLLQILGDLTSKLKGMEQAVQDTHTDERRESSSTSSDALDAAPDPAELKLMSEKYGERKKEGDISDSVTEEHFSKGPEGHSPRESGEHSPTEAQLQPSSVAEEHSARENEEHSARETESLMDHMPQGSDSSTYFSNSNEAGASQSGRFHEEHKDYPDKSMASNDLNHIKEEFSNERPEQISHMINKFKQHDRPFIFNTESIEYKGPTGVEESKYSSQFGDEKDSVHHQSFQHPIISTFYGDSQTKSNDESSLEYRPHSEASISAVREASPTQRDGSHSLRNSESNGPTVSMEIGEQNIDTKSKPIEAKESKPEVDEDLPDYNEVKDAAIFEENLIRKTYHADNLRWSDDLSDEAQKTADELSVVKNLDPGRTRLEKGENVALIPLNSLNVGKDSADAWKKESTKFDFVSPFVNRKNSDFVQMIWKSAKEFGLGVAKSADKSSWIVVAKYDTPIAAEYQKLKGNVESDIPVTDPYSDIARRSMTRS